MDIGEKIVEIENGITHNLARPMVGDIAAPIDLIELGPFRRQLGFIGQKVLHFPAFSQGKNVGMLHEQKVIGSFRLGFFPPVPNFKVNDLFKKFLLIVPSLLVVLVAEVYDIDNLIFSQISRFNYAVPEPPIFFSPTLKGEKLATILQEFDYFFLYFPKRIIDFRIFKSDYLQSITLNDFCAIIVIPNI